MHELKNAEAREILSSSKLGILSLAHNDDSYAIPLYYAYDGESVYFHCHPGLKDEWIEGGGRACLVVTHVASENIWESVQAFGPVEKLSLSTDIEAAKSALYSIPFPPAEGVGKSGKPVRSDQKMYWLRLNVEEIEGKGSTYAEGLKAE